MGNPKPLNLSSTIQSSFTVVSWHVRNGDFIAKGKPVLTVHPCGLSWQQCKGCDQDITYYADHDFRLAKKLAKVGHGCAKANNVALIFTEQTPEFASRSKWSDWLKGFADDESEGILEVHRSDDSQPVRVPQSASVSSIPSSSSQSNEQRFKALGVKLERLNNSLSVEKKRFAEQQRQADKGKGFIILFAIASFLIFLWASSNARNDFLHSAYLYLALGTPIFYWWLGRGDYRSQAPSDSSIIDLEAAIVSTRKEMASVQAQSKKLARRSRDYWRALQDVALEQEIRQMFADLYGQDFRITPGSGDQGIDLIGADQDGVPILVQAKGWSQKVGQPAVRDFVGACQVYKDPKWMVFVAPNGLNAGALQFAKTCNVVVVDANELARLSSQVSD